MRRIYLMTASLNWSPATLMEADSTTPDREMTAMSAGAAADVHHHVAVGLGDVDAGADGGGHRLLNEVDLPGAGLDARVDDGALLHLGDAGGDADDDPGLEEAGSRPTLRMNSRSIRSVMS